jgi:hypothetical protein
MVYPELLPLMRTPRLPVVDSTDALADLNGLVRFAERRNLVSARVHRGEAEVKLKPIRNLVLEVRGRSAPRPGPLYPRYPLYRRLVGPQGRSGEERKISPPPGFVPSTVQHVVSRKTDCAIPSARKT